MLPLFLLAYVVSAQHVWHVVNVSDTVWCELAHVFEPQSDFVDCNNKSITNFSVADTFKFGLVLSHVADFNMIYSLTCMKQDCPRSPCSRVTFIISATGPAYPVINLLTFQNATGMWTLSGDVVQFFVGFPKQLMIKP
jgi:hypothetical protein